jgi:hypothetical protein
MSRPKSATAPNVQAREQSLSCPYVMQMVKVAVLPPRLPQPLTAPTGGSGALTFSWDEPLPKPGAPECRKPWVKRILSTERTGQNPSRPPFIMKEVRYNEWRRHYAKDNNGNYRGTHAPAEDCLLLPHDAERWRLGEATTVADQWTRGKYALPVYGEEKEFEVGLPAYHEKDPLAAASEEG